MWEYKLHSRSTSHDLQIIQQISTSLDYKTAESWQQNSRPPARISRWRRANAFLLDLSLSPTLFFFLFTFHIFIFFTFFTFFSLSRLHCLQIRVNENLVKTVSLEEKVMRDVIWHTWLSSTWEIIYANLYGVTFVDCTWVNE